MIKMSEIKAFYGDRGIKITTEKTNYSGRSYRLGDDPFPLSRKQLEEKYLSEKRS